MKKVFLLLLLSIVAIGEVKVKELAIRHEGEIVNGKAFLTYGGKQGDVFVVSSGSCTVSGLSVLFHKTGECNGEFARVTCSGGQFQTIIKLDQDSLRTLSGKISVSELTGLSPQEGALCSSAAASIKF